MNKQLANKIVFFFFFFSFQFFDIKNLTRFSKKISKTVQ
jgi:hypothetical protein